MNSSIIVKASFEGIHQYKNAPIQVEFLRDPHRHIFNVEIEMEVFDLDRDIEFILLKRDLNKYLYTKPFNIEDSCETMASKICRYLIDNYGERQMVVTVLEDGENGGRVYHANK